MGPGALTFTLPQGVLLVTTDLLAVALASPSGGGLPFPFRPFLTSYHCFNNDDIAYGSLGRGGPPPSSSSRHRGRLLFAPLDLP